MGWLHFISPHLQYNTDQLIKDLGIRTGGRNLTDLRYADDKAFTSTRRIIHRVNTAGSKKVITLNAKKTKDKYKEKTDSQKNIQL